MALISLALEENQAGKPERQVHRVAHQGIAELWASDQGQYRAYNKMLLERPPEWWIFIGKFWPSMIFEIIEIAKERVRLHQQHVTKTDQITWYLPRQL